MKLLVLIILCIHCLLGNAQSGDTIEVYDVYGKTHYFAAGDTAYQFIYYSPPVCSQCLKDSITKFKSLNSQTICITYIIALFDGTIMDRIINKKELLRFPISDVFFSKNENDFINEDKNKILIIRYMYHLEH